MKLKREELKGFINNVCKELFKESYKQITASQKITLKANLMVRKQDAEQEDKFVYDALLDLVREDDAPIISSDYDI